MSAEDDDDAFPRSMRHRRVLDAAEEHPDASIDEIASMVPSATPDLVEHVFEEHGDPAAEEAEATDTADDSQESDSTATTESTDDSAEDSAQSADSTPETGADEPPALTVEELSDRQQELLELVAARPDATQGELADHFDVTRATVSRWASEIEGFEWSDRAAVVARTFETPPTAVSTDGGSTAETTSGQNGEAPAVPDGAAADLSARLDGLESRLADLESADDVDVELAHKIAHACLQSEAISEDEELRILEWLLE